MFYDQDDDLGFLDPYDVPERLCSELGDRAYDAMIDENVIRVGTLMAGGLAYVFAHRMARGIMRTLRFGTWLHREESWL